MRRMSRRQKGEGDMKKNKVSKRVVNKGRKPAEQGGTFSCSSTVW